MDLAQNIPFIPESQPENNPNPVNGFSEFPDKPKSSNTQQRGQQSIMKNPLNEESVVNANALFWQQMLGMQLHAAPHPEPLRGQPGQLTVGRVHLTGAWQGSIEVRLADKLARAATSAMLMLPPSEVSEADTLDAIREIANMIAGTIKSALPRPCAMSVPESELQTEALCPPHRSDHHPDHHPEDRLEVGFHHAEGSMVVLVCEEACCPA
jgi:hypothetical protein